MVIEFPPTPAFLNPLLISNVFEDFDLASGSSSLAWIFLSYELISFFEMPSSLPEDIFYEEEGRGFKRRGTDFFLPI